MPSINFKAKVDQTELDQFQRNAKHKLKEIAAEAKVLGKVFGEHTVGKFAKLASLGIGGFGIGAGISLAAIGVEKLAGSIEKTNEAWKEQAKLVQDLAKEYGTSVSAAQQYLTTLSIAAVPRQRGESETDYEKRVSDTAKPDSAIVSKAIKEALQPENKSRLNAFAGLGVSEEMIRTPGNELNITSILKKTGITKIPELSKAFGSAKEALAFSDLVSIAGQSKFNMQGRGFGAEKGPNVAELRKAAIQAELEGKVEIAKEKTKKIADDNLQKQDELNQLLEEQSKLNKSNLVDAEKWETLQQKIIPLQKNVTETQRKQAEEVHDIQFKNQVDSLSKEKQLGAIAKEALKQRLLAESLPKGSEEQRRAEIKAAQLDGEFNAHVTAKQRAQFEIDTHAKEETFRLAAGEFTSRAHGRALVGGFAGTNAHATSNIGLGETNRILSAIHSLILQKYNETTFSQDLFSLH